MKYGFIKTATPSFALRVADCEYNSGQIIAELTAAHNHGVEVLVLPELCITGCTCKDLFWQDSLLTAALCALDKIVASTHGMSMLCFVGLPVQYCGKLFSCAAAISDGKLLGLVPKACATNDTFVNDSRIFSDALQNSVNITINDITVPFGTKLLFTCAQCGNLSVGAVLGGVDAILSQAIILRDNGAEIIVHLSAACALAGSFYECKANVLAISKLLNTGYVYTCAGEGESTTDLVYAGSRIIAESGVLLAETSPFMHKTSCADIDIEKISKIRLKASAKLPSEQADFTRIPFNLSNKVIKLDTPISKEPYVPLNYDKQSKDAYWSEIYTIQAHGLAKRMAHISAKSAVIGVSGGLDSTLALLVIVKAFTLLKMPLECLIAVTMPCFGTSERTHNNAVALCTALGVTLREIAISDTVLSHFKDISHNSDTRDVTYENAQARMRTMVLFDLANKENGLVIGTGDVSELALGFATFGGDHISMYNVNASLPKTIIRHVIDNISANSENALSNVLNDILITPVSPELLPSDTDAQMQKTEDLVGPYELHDFFLYYALQYGFTPEKIYFLAQNAFNSYSNETILHWLNVFYSRFFSSQFKRSCMPDGPQCCVFSLSPRGGLEMPSDAMSSVWRSELTKLNNIK